MSPRAKVTVSQSDTPPTPGVDTDTGKRFVGIRTQRGPLLGEARNMTQFAKLYGKREDQVDTTGWDDADNYFHEGGRRLLVSRRLGPSPVKASRNLSDGSQTALTVAAAEYGSYDIEVEVTHPTGSTFEVIVYVNDQVAERTGEVATTAAAVAAAAGWSAATLAQGISTSDPAVLAKSALTGGTDDSANATSTQDTQALARFTKAYGPGQVCLPGATSATLHAVVMAHCVANNRVPILDGVDSATIANVTSPAVTDRATVGAEYAGLFWPWVKIPGLTPGSTRTVPPSGTVCGIIARNDGAGLSVNIAAAGEKGFSNYAVGLSKDAPTDVDWDTLADAGVNVLRVYGLTGVVQVYGFDTLADPATKPRWTQLTGSRLFMLINARWDAVGEKYIFGENTVDRALINRCNGALVGELLKLGKSISAFNVDTDTVNDDDTMADGELNAAGTIAAAPFVRSVNFNLSKVLSNEAVAA